MADSLGVDSCAVCVVTSTWQPLLA